MLNRMKLWLCEESCTRRTVHRFRLLLESLFKLHTSSYHLINWLRYLMWKRARPCWLVVGDGWSEILKSKEGKPKKRRRKGNKRKLQHINAMVRLWPWFCKEKYLCVLLLLQQFFMRKYFDFQSNDSKRTREIVYWKNYKTFNIWLHNKCPVSTRR